MLVELPSNHELLITTGSDRLEALFMLRTASLMCEILYLFPGYS